MIALNTAVMTTIGTKTITKFPRLPLYFARMVAPILRIAIAANENPLTRVAIKVVAVGAKRVRDLRSA